MNDKAKKPGFVKNTVLTWLGLNSNTYGVPINGATSTTGAEVTPDSALKLPTVWACTRVIAQTIATFPIHIYERESDDVRTPRPNLPISRILTKRPNEDMSAVMFWEALLAQALLWGNAFAERLYIGDRLVGLDVLSTERLTWRRLNSGEYLYSYVDLDGKRREIQQKDIFHVPGYSTTGRFGLSVISYAVNVMGAAISSDAAAASTFKNGLMPTTYFKWDRNLKPEQRTEARGAIAEISGALNAGKSPLLEKGMEVGEVGINPADAQLLESRNFSSSQICQWFGVPPPIVGITDKASSWASSSEQMNLWFLQYGLMPWIRRITDAIWLQLFTPAQQSRLYAEFKYEGLLRADTPARASLYASALQNGWMNRSTVARLENAPPIPGGDVYTVQSNLVPLDQLGQSSSDSEQLRAAMSQFLNADEEETEDGT